MRTWRALTGRGVWRMPWRDDLSVCHVTCPASTWSQGKCAARTTTLTPAGVRWDGSPVNKASMSPPSIMDLAQKKTTVTVSLNFKLHFTVITHIKSPQKQHFIITTVTEMLGHSSRIKVPTHCKTITFYRCTNNMYQQFIWLHFLLWIPELSTILRGSAASHTTSGEGDVQVQPRPRSKKPQFLDWDGGLCIPAFQIGSCADSAPCVQHPEL